ncbi:unnamed protein product [Camellia sinensis]
MNFLSNILREEGGFDYKKAIVDSIVRDRATLYLNMLEVDGAIVETDKDVKNFLFGSLDVPLVNLEMSLKNYVQEPSEEPFDIDSVPKEVKSLPLAEKKAPGKKPTGLGAAPTAPTSTVDAYEKLLSSIPEFSSFGKLFKSSAPVELTEAETKYVVNTVQHIFDRHVVFQYNCTNSIPEQLLENVTVVVDASDTEKFTEVSTRPLRSLPYDSPGQTFVVFEKPEGVPQLENSRTSPLHIDSSSSSSSSPMLGSLQNPSQLSKKQQKQEREWFAVSFKPENFIPGLVIGFIFGLFLDLSKPIKNNNNTTPKKAANLLLGKQQRLVSTNTDEELKMILRASMEGFLDAFMEQVTAFPNKTLDVLWLRMQRLSRTRAEASIKIQNVKSVLWRMKKAITDNPKKLANLIDFVNLPSTLREFVGQSQISFGLFHACLVIHQGQQSPEDPSNKNVVNCDEKLRSILLE